MYTRVSRLVEDLEQLALDEREEREGEVRYRRRWLTGMHDLADVLGAPNDVHERLPRRVVLVVDPERSQVGAELQDIKVEVNDKLVARRGVLRCDSQRAGFLCRRRSYG